MNFLESPLYKSLFNDNIPRIILDANDPDFTIIDYNDAFKSATYTIERNVKGQSVWVAYPKDDTKEGTKILAEGLNNAVKTSKKIQLPPFQYDIPSADMRSIEPSWWQVEIEPIAGANDEVDFLLIKTLNITDKIKVNDTISNYIEREEILNRKLFDTYEELASSNEELQTNLEDLRTTNEALANSRRDLQSLNAELENRIQERTKDLQSSRLLLQNIVSTANVAMTLLKGESLVIELANHKMLEIWQRPLEAVEGKKITDVFPELKTQRFPKLLADVFKTGKRIAMPEVPVDISYPNGEMKLIYVDFSYDPIFGTGGKVEYILATVNDITTQVENFKQLEESKSELQAITEELAASNEELSATNEELATTNEELQEAQESLFVKNETLAETEESLRLALASGNLGTYSVVPSTGKFEISQKAREFYGLPLNEEISWADVTATVVPEHVQVIERARVKALATNQPFDVQYPIIQPNTNEVKWIRVVGKSVPPTKLRPARFLGVIMDITTEVEHRLAIEESEARFRNMAEATDVFIAVGDLNGNATYFNNAWTRVTGRLMHELLAFGWVDLIHPEDKERYVNLYLSAFEKQEPFTGEFRILGTDGEYKWLLAKGTPRFHTDGTFMGYISSSVDITELKKDEIRKNDFIGMVSHELKTPLTAISGFVQVLQARAKKTEDNYALSALNRAYNQVKKMTTMINGFLNVSRLESGKLLIEKTQFQLDELLKELIDESDIVQFSHEIKLEIKEPVSLFADRDKIGSVVSNLLSNAVKYSSAGTRIDVSCEVIDNKALVSITDHGIGIDAEDTEKLFDRYYRVNKQHTVSGFGIGLYLSAEIIERHNGKIGVTSKVGEGSTFYFEIPLNES
ncbi:PAS domain S-box protein [Pedobacter rhodius]|uniref:histidine kinase n=1 Tax=Pedobacter rhodius TaxID=3004098 RepID=A0ABT4KWS2_9SPHI|nr:PAS domain S-box protein [Pedobacter sp. SJ11]MCZ4223354.1 PAS domain S-box protein [Pedobacter sp. SJ11]